MGAPLLDLWKQHIYRGAVPQSECVLEEFEKLYKRNKDLYPSDMRAVEEKCDDCDAVSPLIRATDEVKRGSHVVYEARVSGVNEDLPKIQSLDLAEGRFITDFDVAHARSFAVIGSQIRDEMFGPAEALGKDIKLGGDSFTVIGVEARNGNMGGMSLDNNVYIPYLSRPAPGCVLRPWTK